MSRLAKILIKKKFHLPKKEIHRNLIDIIDTFHTELRVEVKDSIGFVKADSYWKQNENTIITLMDWEKMTMRMRCRILIFPSAWRAGNCSFWAEII